jgi:hypothetical protein
VFFPVVVIAGIIGLFALFFFGNSMRRKAAEQQLGPVKVNLEPSDPGPGQLLTLTCEVTPKRDVAVNNIHCDFSAIERVVRGSGTNQTTYTENIFQEWVPMEESVTLTANEPRIFTATCELPDDAPLSFKFPSNTLEWSATLRIDIPRWPDWLMHSTFNVLPNRNLLESEKDNPVASVDAPAEGLW